MIDLAPYARTITKPVAVLGLGLSGMATIRACLAAGIEIAAWDDNADRRSAAQDLGAHIVDLANADVSPYAALVLAPGIPLHFPQPHPAVRNARAANVEVIGDIELLHRAHPGVKTIGITGTNGKSTTTALIGHILAVNGIDAPVGGNIGTAALDLNLPDKNGVIVLELSSYQLDLCAGFAPSIAIHLNLTPDHIDRHGDLAGYIDAKMRIFRGPGTAIIGADDRESLAMQARVRAEGQRQIYAISATSPVTLGAFVRDGILWDAVDGLPRQIGDLAGCKTLPGAHNHQNAAAAYAACRLCGLAPDAILAAMETYPGLPHRMFATRTIGRVDYINDSKATNADAAGKALTCTRNIYWILGGKPKAGGLDGLEPFMDRIARAYVIGEAAGQFAEWLKSNNVVSEYCGTLEKAVAAAHRDAQRDAGHAVVLLSPACASFDQFRSFEHRGDVFTALVNALPAERNEA